jgi:hydroxyacylglutathione hydrolase
MAVDVRQFPCLSDNYGFLVRDADSGLAACVDTPDADAVLAALKQSGWSLSLILNTHWHPDHAGGNAAVKAATGAQIVGPAEVRKIAPLDREVGARPATRSATSPITTRRRAWRSSATPCSRWVAASCSRGRRR